MKRLFFFLFAWWLCGSVSAQTAVLSGRILSGTDSTALIGTTVVMVDDMQVNVMSDVDGYFELKGVPYGNQEIQFAYLGYVHKIVPVEVKEPTVQMGDVCLDEMTSTIEEIVVRGSTPMAIIKGDTVQYNAEAFKTNPDADVEELIVKMPGVIIQQGKIEAQGEPVRRIYVDGKLFFGTDPMAALKSLPADAVESIQLFDAPSEESRMTGFDDGNTQKAINIVTKTKMRKTTIVKAEAGGGTDLRTHDRDFRYLTGGNFSRFTPNHRLTVSLLSNNVNTMRFGDPELSGDQELDANGNVRNQPQGVQNINGAGMNYVYEVDKVKIESSYFFDRNHNHTINHTENNFYPVHNPGNDKRSIEQKSTISDNEFFTTRITNRANLRLEYKPSNRNTIVFSPRLTTSDYTLDPRGSKSFTMQDYEEVNRIRSFTNTNSLNLNFSGDLLWTHRFNKRGRSVTLSLNYTQNEYDYNQYVVDSLRENLNAKNVWVNNPLNRYTSQDTYTNSVRGRVMWAEPIATYHRIMGNYTYRREWSDYDRKVQDYEESTGDYTKPLANQITIYDRDYTTNSLGLGYALYRRNVTVTAEMEYQRADQKRIQESPRPTSVDSPITTRLTFYSWQPLVTMKYTIQKKRYLRLRYSGRTVLPDISQMQDVLNTTNQNYLRYGNPNLREGYNNSLELFYNATKVERSTNLTFTLRATTRSNFVATRNYYIVQDTLLSVIPSDPNSEMHEARAGAQVSEAINMNGYYTGEAAATYSFTLKPIKSNINLSGSYGRTQVPSYFADESNIARTNAYGVRVGITSNVSQNVDFNIYSTTVYNDTKNSVREDNTFLNQNFFYSVNIIFWKGFVFNSVLSWRYYTSSTAEDMNSSFYVLNAALGKKVFARQNGEIRLSVYDLLDQNTNRLHYVRDTYVSDVYTNTVGRYVTLRFAYRFNSLSHRKGTVEIKNAQQIGTRALQRMSTGGQGQRNQQDRQQGQRNQQQNAPARPSKPATPTP